MGVMEIVLLAAGGIVFVLSFLIPAKKEETGEETIGLAREELRALVSEELEAVRGHVDDVVEEAVSYSMEKTERSLERLSNEKIMAVNEYSDTVLAEIHKNHEEVMFLYDMLNDKHNHLKNTVSEVNRTVKEVAETKREAEEVVNTFQRLAPEMIAVNPMAPQFPAPVTPFPMVEPAPLPVAELMPVAEPLPLEELLTPISPMPVAAQPGFPGFMQEPAAGLPASVEAFPAPVPASPEQEAEEQEWNNNDRILELYRDGKSKVAIARELGLGVGEVQLVIDLYKHV